MTVQDRSVDCAARELSHLAAEGAAALLDRSICDYGRLLREGPADLRPEHVDALDYGLRHIVVRLLVRAAEPDELSDAYDALRRLVPVEREDELADWLPRWRAFADLLDARLSSLAAREPERALSLLHAREILELVASDQGLPQTEICNRREGLKPANLSRILGVLEAHELIERRTVGRQKRVYLGRLASGVEGLPRIVAEAVPATSESEGVARTMSYLYADAA